MTISQKLIDIYTFCKKQLIANTFSFHTNMIVIHWYTIQAVFVIFLVLINCKDNVACYCLGKEDEDSIPQCRSILLSDIEKETDDTVVIFWLHGGPFPCFQ